MINRISVRLCALLVLVVAMLLAPATMRAAGTPTPQLPFRVYLPLIFKDMAPAQPLSVTFQQGLAE